MIVDTGAPWCVLDPRLADCGGSPTETYTVSTTLHVRGMAYEEALVRAAVTLQATRGADLEIEATFFIPRLAPGEVWPWPNFLGLEGFLSRIRFAVDAAENVLLWTSVKETCICLSWLGGKPFGDPACCRVEYIIGNPGTTELPLMDVLPDHPEFKYILTLQEGVAMAMADGYALASGKLGVLNVHVAPGLGNAMGMLYDAAKTAAPLLVTAGQQDGRFSLTEPLLWGDMVRMVESMTKWAYQIERVADLPHALRRAIKVATTPPTGPVFLGLPMDIMMAEADLDISAPSRIAPRIRGDLEAMQRAADILAQAQHPLIIVGDEVAKTDALDELVAVAEALGAPVFAETVPNTTSFPSDHPLYQGFMARTQRGVRSCRTRMWCSRWEPTCSPCRCIPT